MQLVWLSLLATVPLASAQADQLSCAIDGAGAIDATTNAGVYLWASTERCPKSSSKFDDIKCEIDIASAVQSVTDMGSIIAKAFHACAGDLNTTNAQCGLAASSLISASSGLAAGAGALTHWIQKKDFTEGSNVVVDTTTTRVGKCIVNAKSVVNSIFQAAAAIKAAQADCPPGADQATCATKSLTVVSVLSNMGSAIAQVVGLCSPSDNKNARMSGDIIGLVASLDKVAQAAIAVHQQCAVSDARLFATESVSTSTSDSSVSMTSLVAFALLPIAGIAGFIGGRRNKAKSHEQIHDVESFE